MIYWAKIDRRFFGSGTLESRLGLLTATERRKTEGFGAEEACREGGTVELLLFWYCRSGGGSREQQLRRTSTVLDLSRHLENSQNNCATNHQRSPTNMAPLRIAVLECDTPPAATNSKYGGYRGLFASLLKESARALGQPERLNPETDLEITGWDVVNGEEYPRLEDVDAILLTGSSEFLSSLSLVYLY